MELKELEGKNDPAPESHENSSNPKDKQPLLKSDPVPPAPAGSETIEELEAKCAAYMRNDVYGTMGRGELPFQEKVMVGFAMLTLVPVRFAVGMVVVVVYYVICRFCTLFSEPNPEEGQGDYGHMAGWRREVIVRCGKFLSRAMLFVMGFYWIDETFHEGICCEQVENSERPGVIISNHVSYLDILYHMSSSFPSFVAKRSVARLPLVGLISKCLGCVYVQRESKSSDCKGVAGVVTERIQKAQNNLCPMPLLFPEGTTTNGDYLLPFKTGAFLAKLPMLPVLLKYPYERFSPAWDSVSGVRHLILLLCQFVNHLEVVHLPAYCPSQQEKDDPSLYANNVRKLMAIEGNLKLSEVGLAEKRVYHAALKGNSLPRVLHQKDD